MLLSDHVHATQRFIDMFAKQKTVQRPSTQDALMTPLLPPMTSSYASAIASSSSSSAHARVGSADEGGLVVERIPPPKESGYFDIKPAIVNGEVISDEEIDQLASDLRVSLATLVVLTLPISLEIVFLGISRHTQPLRPEG